MSDFGKAQRIKIAYQDRILSFVDIIAWSDVLEDSEVDPSILEPIAEAIYLVDVHAGITKTTAPLPEATDKLRKDMVTSHFSDTLVVPHQLPRHTCLCWSQ